MDTFKQGLNFYTIYKTCKNMASLTFYSRINGDNAQGSCGVLILSDKTEPEISEQLDSREIIIGGNTKKVFYKYGNSGYNCTLARQEYIISQHLLQTCNHFPNFLRPIIYLKNYIVRTDKCKDPFSIINVDKSLLGCVDVAVFEFLDETLSLSLLLKDITFPKHILNSILMQVCLAVIAAQQNAQFTHNDLHSNNIMVLKCKSNIKLLYKIIINSTEYMFFIPTYGYIPIIIDYGFSFSNECFGMSLECIDSDNYGLITYKFDNLTDFIRLFVVLYGSKYSKELSEFVSELFSDLPISLKSSWEKIVKHESSYNLEKVFCSLYYQKLPINKNKYIHYQVLRLLMRNILIPIKYHKLFEKFSFKKEVTNFMDYWMHIEKWFKYDYEKIFILRELLDNIRKICNLEEYITQSQINIISKKFLDSVAFISNKNIPIRVPWEPFIKTINRVVGLIQNILSKNIEDLDKKRQKLLYSKLHSGEQMFLGIKKFLYEEPELFKLHKNDKIFFINNIDKSNGSVIIEKSGEFSITDICDIFS